MPTTIAPAAPCHDQNAGSHTAWCDRVRHDGDGLASCVSPVIYDPAFVAWAWALPGEEARVQFECAPPADGLDREAVTRMIDGLRQLEGILAAPR